MTGGEEANAVLARLIGRWQGRARLWFEPDALAADDEVRGAIDPVGGGRWVRHAYSTQISGSPHSGSALVGFIAVAGLWEQSWADTFHTSGTGIMLSTGAWSDPEAISVTGSYSVGEESPDWGWRTSYEPSDGILVVRHFNVTPHGEESLAVQFDYERA